MKSLIRLSLFSVCSLFLFSTSVFAAELDDAVDRMYDHGLTRFNDTYAFTPQGYLRRDEASKFFANAAQNVLGKQPNANISCMFYDLYKAHADLSDEILDACQLGLFRGSNGYFYPEQHLTYAQIVTVLIRLEDGTEYSDGNVWYQPYYQKAQSRGYLNGLRGNSVSRVHEKVTRGDAALMLYRALGDSNHTDSSSNSSHNGNSRSNDRDYQVIQNSFNTTYDNDITNTYYAFTGSSSAGNACSTPRGGSITAGASVIAYKTPSVAYGQQCQFEMRSCVNGTLQGSYTYSQCAPETMIHQCTLPRGEKMQLGQWRKVYQYRTVAAGQSCEDYVQYRYCELGSTIPSGTYQYERCDNVGTSNPIEPAHGTQKMRWDGMLYGVAAEREEGKEYIDLVGSIAVYDDSKMDHRFCNKLTPPKVRYKVENGIRYANACGRVGGNLLNTHQWKGYEYFGPAYW